MASRESGTSRWQIATEAEIRASPAQVWAILADTARYPQWNPFIVALRGDLVESGSIEFH
ncbi:MAG TPA: SRPBCC family protein, partial [Burkholderiales bacterium]|nr:SRPBCC family protein [Burkholderiales bacterium]